MAAHGNTRTRHKRRRMRNSTLVLAVGMVAAAGLIAMQRRGQGDGLAWEWSDNLDQQYIINLGGGALDELDSAANGVLDGAAQFVDSLTGGVLKLSNMSRVTPADLASTNVQAFLRVIRRGEGTAAETGYRTLFGGGLFEGYADHPRQRITRKVGGRNITSTAAGAYQFLSSTWDETASVMQLQDFSPASQDLAAVGRIAARGALADVKAGRFDAAIKKVANEWASMPGSPYGQPVITLATARSVYAAAGGAFA